MPQFSYKARREGGELIEGALELPSAESVAGELSRQGLIPLDIRPSEGKGEGVAASLSRPFGGGVSLDDKLVFCRQMHSLSRAGVPIIRALTSLKESARSEQLAEVLGDVTRRLEGGVTLAASMRAHPKVFDELFIAMVLVGENTGRLDEVFLRLSENLELERETRKQVAQAVRYPVFVVVTLVAALIILNIFVIPAFANVFAKLGADLPLPTQVLIACSDFMVNNGVLISLVVVFLAVLFWRWKRTEEGRLRWSRFIFRIPKVGPLLRLVAMSRFARSFSMMLRSGLPVTQALTLVSGAVHNAYMGQSIIALRASIERGESLLRASQQTDLFSPLVLQMLAVGEETGNLDELLDQVASYYEEEVAYELKRLSSSIEPILLVIMGVMVLILALGVFLPMWDLGSVALKSR